MKSQEFTQARELYLQGGLTPQVSYSSMFGANVAALYQLAVAGG